MWLLSSEKKDKLLYHLRLGTLQWTLLGTKSRLHISISIIFIITDSSRYDHGEYCISQALIISRDSGSPRNTVTPTCNSRSSQGTLYNPTILIKVKLQLALITSTYPPDSLSRTESMVFDSEDWVDRQTDKHVCSLPLQLASGVSSPQNNLLGLAATQWCLCISTAPLDCNQIQYVLLARAPTSRPAPPYRPVLYG